MLDALALGEQQHLVCLRRAATRGACASASCSTTCPDAARQPPTPRFRPSAWRASRRAFSRSFSTKDVPARLIAFPAGHAPHEPPVSRTRPASRWIAAAAVAGLVVGVLAGRFGHDYSFAPPCGRHG